MRLLRRHSSLLRPLVPFLTLSRPRSHSTKVDSSNGSSMIWSAAALSTVTSDTEPTIVINFDNARYIFNTGENSNRAFLQSKTSWKRCRGIFLTQADTKRMSGLTGMIMSLADAGIKSLDIVGPPGTTHLLASMRFFTFRDTIKVNPTELDWEKSTKPEPDFIYKDENITVYSVPIGVTPESDESTPVTLENIADIPPETPLKRKREPSPEQSQKRRVVDTEASSGSLRAPSPGRAEFSPDSLSGDLAREWRKKIVSVMFPATHVKPDVKPLPTPQGKRGKAGMQKNSDEKNVDTPVAPPLESLPEEKSGQFDDYRRSRARVPAGFHKQLPKFSWSETPVDAKMSFAYIAVGPRIRGKFNVKKAEALGVYGKDRSRIAKGETIVVKIMEKKKVVGERTVKPEECLEAAEPPSAVIVLDIPTPDHIPSLIASFSERPFYRRFRSTKPEDLTEVTVSAIFHLCGKDVLEDERYIQFMNGFNPTTRHIISSKEHTPDSLTFTSSGYNQLRLNMLDPEMFPKPAYSLTPKKSVSDISEFPSNSHIMVANMFINLRPLGQPYIEPASVEADRFHPIARKEQTLTVSDGALERFAVARQKVADGIKEKRWPVRTGANIGIIPLGTGSAMPTKYRNVSSTLIQIPDWGNILLDAGEGTWGQLARHFGVKDADSPNAWHILRDIKCIFISHVHADHHMGLAKLLAIRRTLNPPPPDPLYLITIRGVHLYLQEMSDVMDLGIDDRSSRGVIPIMSEALHYRNPDGYSTTGMWQVGGSESWTDIRCSRHHAAEMCSILGLTSFATVDVYHRTRAYGAVITHDDGWRIAFSGDTMPTDNLVWAGKNASVLIHEATMCDDQEVMAKKKAHSTFGQAVAIGRKMRAENILLTHFSARYPKLPPSMVDSAGDVEACKDGPVIGLAFDHARLTIGNMWKLSYYLTALEKTVKDTAAEEGDEEELETAEPVDSVDMA